MSRRIQHYSAWLQYDGKKVLVDGITYTIHAKNFMACYPVEEEMITVMAEPCNKQSKMYRTIKAQLGEDWCTDVLESDSDIFVKFMSAAAAESQPPHGRSRRSHQ